MHIALLVILHYVYLKLTCKHKSNYCSQNKVPSRTNVLGRGRYIQFKSKIFLKIYLL